MILNPNILKNIRQISFTAQEPSNTNVLWAKPENGLFAFYLFYNNKWELVSSSEVGEIPEVSVYLSAFINDVGYLTADTIQDCEDIIGIKQIKDESIAETKDIKDLFNQ